ncbi:DoxX family protein [Streptomyces sp. LP05-1]|uniref:DoxX family protein n=1 Tax=Streptomyces pyxinae TaxID=2970734 RepID=A0ABT2CMT8_9ACTN|nr:DoxX family protein [Streptomyces sp. LP05-1]MCS0638757.1 DoxX family protein [Streptomyces sp. LP05-1]
MSVDTRTPKPGFDDQPALSMVKVDCDPAQVIVNHASFRVQLAPVRKPRFADPARRPVMSTATTAARRRAPVVWSGKSAPGDPVASGLLQAVRRSAAPGGGVGTPREVVGATRVIPRLGSAGRSGGSATEDTMPNPVVGAQRTSSSPLLPPMRRAVGAYDEQAEEQTYDGSYGSGQGYGSGGHDAHHGPSGPAYDGAYDASAYGEPYDGSYDESGYGESSYDADGPYADEDGERDRAGASHRHAYYPGRRMNLGVVLLPLRVFLGFISIYAGMGKLSDPVYFDGGERGSMVNWLNSLHPWPLAEPLRDFALDHPVGAGLTIAFAQVVVGVLTVLGLWQRVAAAFGALLSAALILTVSWKSVPVYEAPDFIYLAAWSPLVIAGAPVYSLDGRLAGEAWRTLGPRSALWELRRRVLRRGLVVGSVVIGLTLLVGSILGGAVRSTEMVTVPGPDDAPTNHLPGQSLPQEPDASSPSAEASEETSPEPSVSASEGPTDETRPPAAEEEAPAEPERAEVEQPTATQGTGQEEPEEQKQYQPEPPPSSSAGPSSSGGSGGGSGSGGGGDETGSDGSDESGSTSGGGGNRNPLGGLLG